ncbi:MAG: hypothetical protein KBG20_09205 [Caldilineaceae bacterium]|nr:hypothetical protein [Caldilineaceae bacterium]MBP8108402.1 hypothetical protein [Caldilineaceae bacterium]MBP8124797.1 hypothetical protein [Caldilineaceae bacterium]MBP9072465.1 hypothetical protein [Caldilineaceae bacterium]
MTDNRLNTLFWAVALTLAGLLLLFYNFDMFAAYEPTAQYLLAGLLGAGGVGFFVAYLSTRQNWWRLIPVWTLLALAAMMLLTTQPQVNDRVTAGVLFVGLALAFAHIYLLDRGERWWAIIPGGFMLVLGGVIALSARTEKAETLGAVLFAGMGAVFFLLYVLGGKRRQWWALIPGAVLIIFGLFIFVLDKGGENTLLRWWPLILIGVGLFLGWRAYAVPPKPQKLPINTAPATPRPALPVSPAVTKANAASSAKSGKLGEYTAPAPGASVVELPEREE